MVCDFLVNKKIYLKEKSIYGKIYIKVVNPIIVFKLCSIIAYFITLLAFFDS